MSWRPAGPAALFVPGDRPELVAKALDRADLAVVDLEDAVGPDAKEAARDGLRALETGLDWERLLLRVNAPGTPWLDADLALARSLPFAAVVLPMTEDAAHVAACGDLTVIPLIETARGVENVGDILEADGCAGAMWGSEDLSGSLGGRRSRRDGRLTAALSAARASVLIAAAARGLPAVDAVAPDFSPGGLAALQEEAREAADMGFAAKACIHPAQIAAVRSGFRPDAHELVAARALLQAAEGREGAFSHDGALVDAPILEQARRVAARSEMP